MNSSLFVTAFDPVEYDDKNLIVVFGNDEDAVWSKALAVKNACATKYGIDHAPETRGLEELIRLRGWWICVLVQQPVAHAAKGGDESNELQSFCCAHRDSGAARAELSPVPAGTLSKTLIEEHAISEMRYAMKQQASDEDDDIDIFTLPMHLWAARFPMLSDEELEQMAQSIKEHGQRSPVVLGIAIIANGFPPRLCVVDGRNRIEACRRAGVKPEYIILETEDLDEYIEDVNMRRRDLTKGQKAMLLAVRYPDASKGGRGHKGNSIETIEISQQRISHARVALKYCPEMVDQVIAGALSLDEAYKEATRHKIAQQSLEPCMTAMLEGGPALEELIRKEQISAAAAEQRNQEEQTVNDLRSTVEMIQRIDTSISLLAGEPLERVAGFWLKHRDHFKTRDLAGDLARWKGVFNRLQEAIEPSPQ